MELCSDNHQEICYEGRYCPACELLDKIVELEKQTEILNEEE